MSLDSLQAGARLGSYVVLSRLGVGGMGVVYEARDEALGRLVALKVPSRELVQDPTARARFAREALAAAAVVHPNVVGVHGVDHAAGWPYLVLEHVPGGSLRGLLRTRRQLPWREACALARGIAQGLGALHARGLVHRDLKPENVLLDQEGRPKVSDFGLARSQGAGVADLTRTGQFLGTPGYVAPEQIDRPQEVGPAADLYALGCILFELLEGAPPFPGSSYDVLNKHLSAPPPPLRATAEAPRSLAPLVAALLAKTPAERPTSADVVVASLTALLAGPDAGAARRPGRSRAVWPLVLLTLVAAAAAAVSVWSWSRSVPAPAPPLEAPPRPPGTTTTPVPAPAPASTPAPALPLEEPTEPPAWAERHLAPLRAPGNEVRLTAARGGYRFAHGQAVGALAATPFGLLAGDAAGRLVLWDHDTGEERWRVSAHPGPVIMATDASRRRVVTTSHGEPVLFVWDLRDLRDEVAPSPTRSVEHGLTKVAALTVSADGRAALVSGVRGQVVWCDLEGDAPARSLAGAGLRPDVALAADGRVALASDRSGHLLRWDLSAPAQAPTIVQVCAVAGSSAEQGVFALAARPDGRRVLTGEAGGQVRRWDDGVGSALARHDATVISLCLEWPDGRRALSADGDGGLRLLSVDDPVGELKLPGHVGRVLGLAFLDDGRAASAGSDGTVRQWDLRAGTRHPVDVLAAHEVTALALSHDRRFVAVARDDGDAELWEVDGLRRVAVLGGVPTEKTYSVGVSSRGDVLLGAERRARLFDVAGGSFTDLQAVLTRAVAFESTGLPLATGNDLSGWTAEGVRGIRLRDRDSAIVAFAVAGQDLMVGREDGSVRLWRLPSNPFDNTIAARHVFGVSQGKDRVYALALTPDGRRGAAAVGDVVRLIDLVGEADRDVAHASRFVALSPDGARFATLRGTKVLVVGAWEEAPGSEATVTLESLEDGPCAAVFLAADDLLVGTRRGALLRFRLER